MLLGRGTGRAQPAVCTTDDLPHVCPPHHQPHLGADLVAALAGLQVDDLSHAAAVLLGVGLATAGKLQARSTHCQPGPAAQPIRRRHRANSQSGRWLSHPQPGVSLSHWTLP